MKGDRRSYQERITADPGILAGRLIAHRRQLLTEGTEQDTCDIRRQLLAAAMRVTRE